MLKKKLMFKKPTSAEQTKIIRQELSDELKPFKPNYVPEPEAPSAEKLAQLYNSADKAGRITSEAEENLANLGAQAKAEQLAKQEAFIAQGGAIAGDGYRMPPIMDLPTMYAIPPYKEPRWLTIGEAAKHIKMSPVKFGKMRATGPKFYKLADDTILYNVHDVDVWVMSQPMGGNNV